MSKKKRESSPGMPASSAGLMRFFQDEAHGVKIRPEFVIAGAITLILSVILAHVLFP
jgi:preprotein translocase subunit Sec61beta